MQKNNDILVGKKIRQLREKNGWSIEELALKIPLHKSNVSRMEKYGQGTEIEKLQRLAEIFEVDISEFFKTDEQPVAVPPLRRVFAYIDFTRFPVKIIISLVLILSLFGVISLFNTNEQFKSLMILAGLVLAVLTIVTFIMTHSRFITHELFEKPLVSSRSIKQLNKTRWIHIAYLSANFLTLFLGLGGLLFIYTSVTVDRASQTIVAILMFTIMVTLVSQAIYSFRNPLFKGTLHMKNVNKHLGLSLYSINWLLSAVSLLWIVMNLIVLNQVTIDLQLKLVTLVAGTFHLIYMTIIYLEYIKLIQSYNLPS